MSRGIRVVEDLRNEKITYKIREFSLMKLPFVLVMGKSEVEQLSFSAEEGKQGFLLKVLLSF